MGIQCDDEVVDVFPVVTEPTKPAKPIFNSPAALLKTANAPEDDDVPMDTPTPPPTKHPAHSVNYVKGLRGLMKLAGINEPELLDYLRSRGLDDSLGSLDEVVIVAPTKLQAVYDDWSNVLTEFNRVKKGKE